MSATTIEAIHTAIQEHLTELAEKNGETPKFLTDWFIGYSQADSTANEEGQFGQSIGYQTSPTTAHAVYGVGALGLGYLARDGRLMRPSKNQVTVEVEIDDIRDVLHWAKWERLPWEDYIPDPINARWLAEYAAAKKAEDTDRRDGLFRNMTPSLQWALHTHETDGPWHLHGLLLEEAVSEAKQAAHEHHDINTCEACMAGRKVAGHCPFCASELLLDLDGRVQCVNDIFCPNRYGVAELLADAETEHVVRIEKTGFHVKHPLRERVGDAMLSCRVPTDIHDRGVQNASGIYRVTYTDLGTLNFAEVK